MSKVNTAILEINVPVEKTTNFLSGKPLFPYRGSHKKETSDVALMDIDNQEITYSELIANHAEIVDYIDYEDGSNVPVLSGYVMASLNQFYEPLYQKTEYYIQQLREQFVNMYDIFLKTKHNTDALSMFNKVWETSAGKKVLVGLAKVQTKGYNVTTIKEITIDLNSGIYIDDADGYGFPIWDSDIVQTEVQYMTVEKHNVITPLYVPFYEYEENLNAPNIQHSTKNVHAPVDYVDYDYNNYDEYNQNNDVWWTGKTTSKSTKTTTKPYGYSTGVYYGETKSSMQDKITSSLAHLQKRPALINTLMEDATNYENVMANEDVQIMTSSQTWLTPASQSLVGKSHIMTGTPCQDSADTFSNANSDLTVLVVSDGAGNAKQSHFGSSAMVTSIKRFIITTHKLIFSNLVDNENMLADENKDNMLALCANVSQIITKHAIGTLKDLAAQKESPITDFLGTLLVAVIGKKNMFWYRVGDGAIVTQTAIANNLSNLKTDLLWVTKDTQKPEHDYVWQSLNDVSKAKGLFVNETHFISTDLNPDNIQYGLISAKNLVGVALMTDGLSERLISADNAFISKQMNTFTKYHEQNLINIQTLYNFTHQLDFTSDLDEDSGEWTLKHNGDDCTVAITSRLTDYQKAIVDKVEELKQEELRKKQQAQNYYAGGWSRIPTGSNTAISSKKGVTTTTTNNNGSKKNNTVNETNESNNSTWVKDGLNWVKNKITHTDDVLPNNVEEISTVSTQQDNCFDVNKKCSATVENNYETNSCDVDKQCSSTSNDSE